MFIHSLTRAEQVRHQPGPSGSRGGVERGARRRIGLAGGPPRLQCLLKKLCNTRLAWLWSSRYLVARWRRTTSFITPLSQFEMRSACEGEAQNR
jgi:hypothetical protein